MNWQLVRAEDFIDFNPSESIPKDAIMKKVAMEQLQPFTRDITAYEIAPFNGGSKFRNGDTLMARITPCLENGKTAQVNILNEGEVGFGSTEFIVLRARPGVSDKDFIYYMAISPVLRDKAIRSMVGSSGRQRVQQSVLDATELSVPPLNEQIEIGCTLRAIDDKIANNAAMNNHLQQMAQAFFMDYQSRGTGTIKTIAEIADINKETYSEKENWAFINYLDTSSITDGNITAIQHITLPSQNLPSRARRKVSANDIVYSTVRPNQRHFGIISSPVEQMLVSTGFAVIRSNNKAVCNEYLYLLLTSTAVIDQLQRLAEQSVSTFPSIKPSDIGALEIFVPSIGDCEEIESFLKPLFQGIANNQAESSCLSSLRDALLPRLISGKLSVADLRDAKG